MKRTKKGSKKWITLRNISLIADNLKRAEDRVLSFEREAPLDAARYIRVARGQVDDLFSYVDKEAK